MDDSRIRGYHAPYTTNIGTQRHHKTDHENITTWILFMLDVLLAQAEGARHLIERNEPEQTLSERQIAVLRLLDDEETRSPRKLFELLGKKVPLVTIKQSLSRLVKLRLIKRIGLGRATRYQKS